MKTLTIKDVSREEELDGKAMAEVRGGSPLFVDLNKETIKGANIDVLGRWNVGETAACTGCGMGSITDKSSRFLNVYTG